MLASFLDDKEKMRDYKTMNKSDFLKSYSYLSDDEYELTRILDEIIVEDLNKALDGAVNYGGVTLGGCYYDDFCKYITPKLDRALFIDLVITEIEKDDRVERINISYDDDIIIITFGTKALKRR